MRARMEKAPARDRELRHLGSTGRAPVNCREGILKPLEGGGGMSVQIVYSYAECHLLLWALAACLPSLIPPGAEPSNLSASLITSPASSEP